MSTSVDVAVSGAAPPVLVEALRGGGDVLILDASAPAVFDPEQDRWLIGEVSARVLIDTVPIPSSPHAYLGMARRGHPNRFTVADPDAAAYVSACLRALAHRGCTRIEVKPHVQAQYSRNLDEGMVRLRRNARRKPDLADYEFTRAADREEDDEDYRGPAVLIDDDGTEIEVEVHLLALFQPVDNAVRWSGRVYPSAELSGLHRGLNQPVVIRIGDHHPVEAMLVDQDPWGGSHIAGVGDSPYPLPLLAALAQFGQDAS
ncbi:DUF4873 domain-containing protein [Mycobacterium sp. 21AC1]|uniref:DUF4873 domain-containing protein n=1 Tax=[Mycobacterium] appelbergii TaxID=2939269 RepID=UPI002939046A|nr:DUF4873 domain-containing protein [Mycobacterium sp. 21AC1]MDV3123891.1 DUF4873 domain-containing protein [Mycobacterium sp. 21AC1]